MDFVDSVLEFEAQGYLLVESLLSLLELLQQYLFLIYQVFIGLF